MMNVNRLTALCSYAVVLLTAHPHTCTPAPPHTRTTFEPVPFVVPSVVGEKMQFLTPDCVQLSGWIGARLRAVEHRRLLRMSENALLSDFRRRQASRSPWVGEHVGKFLHAGTLVWVHTGDAKLKEKLDRVVFELLKTQEPDGYLGTYPKDKRFGLYQGFDWDVWVHKYCLIGLLTYYRYTGNALAIDGAKMIGDLLINTFGNEEGKKDIIKAGRWVGMAATSVLEPMVLLYRLTGEESYLDFCHYVAAAIEAPQGPKIVSTLLKGGSVADIGQGKAYEMLSNLVGLLELHRVSPSPDYLQAAVQAWEDIFKNQMYVTGGVSYGERFQISPLLLPPDGSVAETCANVTWLQLNSELLALTGDARYADTIELITFNHLLSAIKPSGEAICYFTPLQGRKQYRTDLNCCSSSGLRGLALTPSLLYALTADGIAVNLYSPSTALVSLPSGVVVRLTQRTNYPADGQIRIIVDPQTPTPFTVSLRIPAWTDEAKLQINDELPQNVKPGTYAPISRVWKRGDVVSLTLSLPARFVPAPPALKGRVAVMRGPLVLALDLAYHPERSLLSAVAIEATDGKPSLTPLFEEESTGELLFSTPGLAIVRLDSSPNQQLTRSRSTPTIALIRIPLTLCPFAQAGASGQPFFVWFLSPPASKLEEPMTDDQ